MALEGGVVCVCIVCRLDDGCVGGELGLVRLFGCDGSGDVPSCYSGRCSAVWVVMSCTEVDDRVE